MKPFTPTEEKLLLVLSLFGLIVPNGLFLYYSAVSPEVLQAALANPVALVFMLEAFFLMILFAWLMHQRGYRSPGWLVFIIMSLVGSMAFSVPAFLYLTSRKAKRALEEK